MLLVPAAKTLYDGIGYVSEKNQALKNELIETIKLNSTIEGDVFDTNGVALTDTVNATPGEMAQLFEPEYFSSVIGYYYQGGSAGLRNTCSKLRMPIDNTDHGHSIRLTLNSKMQVAAYAAIANDDDASVFVLENNSGAIRAWASKSTIEYNVNDIEASLAAAKDVPESLYQRGIYETDPPGSTAKLLTMCAALSLESFEDAPYNDTGTFEVANQIIHNYGDSVYGSITLQEAFKKSVNTYFSNLGTNIVGAEKLRQTFDGFLIGQDISLDFCSLHSTYGDNDIYNAYSLAGDSFGQGSLSITPLQIAMIYQSVVTNGQMLKPYLIESKEVDNTGIKKLFDGATKWVNTESVVLSQTVTEDVSKKAKTILHEAALSYGLTEDALISIPEEERTIYAKSGTAETSRGTNHIYLVAANDKYTFIISVNNTTNSSGVLKAPMLELIKTIGQISAGAASEE